MKNLSKPTSYKSGLLAESIAILMLYCKFYRIIERRYKTRVGEIDIIAMRGKALVFIEVKKRASRNELFESITTKQKQRIVSGAELYLKRNPEFHSYAKRFDAILILPKSFPIHIKNAWESF